MEQKQEEKELVWLPKSLAKKVEALKDSDNFVEEYIRQSRREIETNLDSFDNEIINYKANMIKARKDFKIAVDEMLEANYKVWESMDEDRKSIVSQAEKMIESLRPLKSELNEISNLMNKINKWGVKDLVDMVNHLNSAAPEGSQSRDLLVFLMDNYKRENEY